MYTEDVAIPSLGGGYDCQSAQGDETGGSAVYAFGFTDLDRKIAVQLGQLGNTERNATLDDVFAYYAQTIVTVDNEETAIDDKPDS